MLIMFLSVDFKFIFIYIINQVSLTGLLLPLFATQIDCVFYTLSSADHDFDLSIAFKYLPNAQKKHVQMHLLDFLGLDRVPNPPQKDQSSHLRLIHSHLDEHSASLTNLANQIVIDGEILSESSLKAINDSDAIVSFLNQCNKYSNHIYSTNHKHLWFDTKGIANISENLLRSELRLYRDPDLSSKAKNGCFEVKILTVSEDDQSTMLSTVDSLKVTEQSGWLVFDVTSATRTWIFDPESNHGLFISISDSSGNEVSAGEFGLVDKSEHLKRNPFLLAFFKDVQDSLHRRRRQKRSNYDYSYRGTINENAPHSSDRVCRKWELEVDFNDLGWQEWIIAPLKYPAFYCKGQCSFPLNAHMNATNHAIVQTLVHLNDPRVSEPSCAPTELSSISVLFFDDSGNVVLKKYKNMVVQACGCY